MAELSETASAPVIDLRTTAERRMRLGPFPSGRVALRFAGYATAGALVIPWLGPLAWLPTLGAGFLLTGWQPGGVSLDVRLYDRVQAWERALQPWETRLSARARSAQGAVARVDPGCLVTVLKCEGRPMAFLPPHELEQKFRRYRELLRSLNSGIVVVGVGIPVDPSPWLPAEEPTESLDGAARSAYSEMVGLLCRHRQRRRVYLLQWSLESDAGGLPKLEERTKALAGRLEELGVSPVRLEGKALGASLTRFGWNEASVAEALP